MSITDKNTNIDLGELRNRIDAIDDSIHDLLMQRAKLASAIRAAKSAIEGEGEILSAYRPAREADMLRRLKKRHRGDLPFTAVARIWREIIASLTQMQAPYGLYICGGANLLAFHDIGRFYYGASAHIHVHEDADAVLNAVAEDPAGLGLLPYPEAGEAAPWWPELIHLRQKGISVIASLPFFTGPDKVKTPQPSILVISHAPYEPSGDDTTLLALSAGSEVAERQITDRIRKAGFDSRILAKTPERKNPEKIIALAAINGFWTEEANQGLDSKDSIILGGYANPIATGDK